MGSALRTCPDLAALRDVGLTTVQACGDSALNVVGCPVSGVDPKEVVDATRPVGQAISGSSTDNREYSNLPRKFKMSQSPVVTKTAPGRDQRHRLWPAV